LEAAAVWYDEQQPGLGDDFLDEFERTLGRIQSNPEVWRVFIKAIVNSILTVFLTPLFIA
jgi:hypothetical protein